ncbi:Transmembrane and coiled-coil domain-containing protein 4 [Madurella mycetomatis]|uniref:Transmembrane and coiled-coil domain-containing protein 4 n=1 Tax=Madurella mycetomatis TaxID=100816 RepID=A0A175WIN6_9PEZI|nr:Transmembrane and coiled-coil domain-containing protein 4 [Madurella mycetomatis]
MHQADASTAQTNRPTDAGAGAGANADMGNPPEEEDEEERQQQQQQQHTNASPDANPAAAIRITPAPARLACSSSSSRSLSFLYKLYVYEEQDKNCFRGDSNDKRRKSPRTRKYRASTMAPLASEPRQVLTVLNLARRKALYTLLVEITAWMRSQLEFREPAESFGGAAPLLIDPSAENSIVVPPSSAAPDSAVPSPALVRLRAAAIEHFDAWRKDVLAKLKEVLAAPDDATIVEERRKRTERIAANQRSASAATAGGLGDSLIDDSWGWPDDGTRNTEAERAKAVARLQAHWHAIPTRLVTIPYEDRTETLSCVLLVLLSTGHYSADSRALAVYLASALELPLDVLNTEEREIAKSLVETSTEAAEQQMSAEAEAEKRKQQNQSSRYWKVGLASVAGAAIIGVTGGLAAPVVAGAIGGIMGSVGLGGVASFLGIFWMNGALVGTLFGAFGARMTGEMVDQYAREVEDFRFIPLKDEWGTRGENQQDRRLRVTIGINGWLTSKDDITKPWRCLGDDSEAFALRYEMKSLVGLGESLKELVTSYAWNTIKVELLKRTVLATLWSALWPIHLLSTASTIDNPFSLAKNRSEKAGEILADALINKVQGERPVTLVGYSLGARVIYSCLRSLAQRRAFGLIDTVVFIGAPAPSNKKHWQMMSTVVSGKMFNVFSENDYLLAFLYRATSIQLGVAGLQEIKDVEGVENINLSDEVQGHMRYANIIGHILARCELPVAKGAEALTGKDEGAIKLDDLDKDNAEMGTLIDFGDLSIAEQPPPVYNPMPPSQPPRAQPGSQRTTVMRGVPSALPVIQDPLGVGLSRAHSVPTPNTSAPKPAPLTSQPPSCMMGRQPSFQVSIPREESNTKFSIPDKTNKPQPAYGAANRAASPVSTPVSTPPVSAPPVSAPSVPASSHGPGMVDYHDSSEDEGGIKMVDNDDLDYVDPTPIED